MAGWILPALAYIVLLGAGGVTAKLALRTISWQQLVLWVPIAYLVVSAGLMLWGGTRFPLGSGGAWAAATAVCASSALVLFFYALTKGPASQVTPATSAYPVITVIGSALFLAEKVTLIRGVGTALVVLGVVLLSR
jgi:undecaprenyl phosphate-alpha-L-ara4N flippase subunit ArnE